jgi:hypothetical protein
MEHLLLILSLASFPLCESGSPFSDAHRQAQGNIGAFVAMRLIIDDE